MYDEQPQPPIHRKNCLIRVVRGFRHSPGEWHRGSPESFTHDHLLLSAGAAFGMSEAWKKPMNISSHD